MSSLPALNTISNGTAADASEVDDNFTTLANFVDQELVNRDGSIAMTGELLLANSSPSTSLAAASKGYVDAQATPSTGTLDSGKIRYAKAGNIVHVWTTARSSGATLPAGFRPAAAVVAPAVQPDFGPWEVNITTGGVITTSSGFSASFSVSFSTV